MTNINTTKPLERFWNLIRLDRSDISSIYFYAILNGLMQLSVPIGIQSIIGFVLGASMATSIYVLIFLVVMGVFIVGVLQVNQMKIIERIQQKIFTRYAFEFVDKIPKFDLYKTDNYFLPEKANRFFDTVNLQKGFSKLLLDIPTALIQILFGLILLSFYHPLFIIFGITLALLLFLIVYFTSKNGLETSINESNYKYEVVAWMQEISKSIKSFKLNQDTGLNFKSTDKILVNYLKTRTKHFKFLLVQYKALIAFKTLVTAFLLLLGVYLLVDQQLNIGEFIAAEIVILSIIASVEILIKNLDSVFDVLTSLEKLSNVTEGNSEENGKLLISENKISIELVDFSFTYPNSKPILKNINIKIPPNSTVCILGEENSGKSTLLNILSRNYLHFTGNFLINNIPANNYDLESFRKKTGIYFNEYEIFSGTVLENINMGKSHITPESIIDIAKELGFESFLQNLTMGFQTPIDANGKRLPKNISQKIILLRALVHRPNLLIMEEPWLGLKKQFQQKMIDYLLKKPSDNTVIVTSNDQAFASKCDYRFELKDGKLEKLP
ncbi:MAG: ATP-binding cassette domain-containing protein [Saprospiraceae bacterium]|jgi:ATP-binding cassette subfamily B protein|uniref:peptidase domain-containing ABC transporter n=1 Tax=Candidatus Brachybacter algidus TaxID=2982024 RepID=UPI001B3EBCFD|nr:ATP-binding cassette domain-containing protein [Candidatus Brachybacter algidus]MBP9124876.1 ATP-binding cassette domain-containing protein [Saprospiraceae bacterium]MBK6447916.1 ATP-binding cassette domain-containing protein [Candidatus Brachybacter algidus]MBK7602727.1 ATP-binding cassette domain-containing protein [Candidatus Brachybacter algidus]MBK8746950.1 ATP-binding cassette domain-containing protein [Candidatus Brachybacter algidus]MBL0117971.1 ATP-binding cassette domain-containin